MRSANTPARQAGPSIDPGPAGAAASPLPVRIALAAICLLFVALAWSHRWYNDDSFITFRYAANLAHGHGFVWNPGGAHVEGSTSLGWTLLNTLALSVGLDPVGFSWAVGLLSGAAGLVLVFVAGRRFLGLTPGWALLAPAILVAGRQWLIWSVAANETRTATTLALAALLLLARELESSPGSRPAGAWSLVPWSGALFFAATLFRPEVPLLHLAAGAGLFAMRRDRGALRTIVLSGALHGVLLAALMGLRVAYFGQPLPNTFYAKVGALQAGRGLWYVLEFPRLTWGLVWVPLLVAGLVVLARQRRLAPLAVAFLVQCAAVSLWLAAIGGDAWEFRFLDALLPGLALLLAAGACALPRAIAVAAALALVVTQAASGFMPFGALAAWPSPWGAQFKLATAEEMKDAADVMLGEGRTLARLLSLQDRISTGWAGAVPYVTGAWHFDPWGLNDPDVRKRPFDEKGALYHQRVSRWPDLEANSVMFVDAYNQFLFRKPYPPNRVPQPAMPWIPDGTLIHCVPVSEGGPFWIFASTRSRDEIEAWLRPKGLRLYYSEPIRFRPAGAP